MGIQIAVSQDGSKLGSPLRYGEDIDFISIGSAEQNDIVLDDRRVSRYHAVVARLDDGRYFFRDLSSRNGSFRLQKQIRVWQRILQGEDIIEIGSHCLKFAFGSYEQRGIQEGPDAQGIHGRTPGVVHLPPQLAPFLNTEVRRTLFDEMVLHATQATETDSLLQWLAVAAMPVFDSQASRIGLDFSDSPDFADYGAGRIRRIPYGSGESASQGKPTIWRDGACAVVPFYNSLTSMDSPRGMWVMARSTPPVRPFDDKDLTFLTYLASYAMDLYTNAPKPLPAAIERGMASDWRFVARDKRPTGPQPYPIAIVSCDLTMRDLITSARQVAKTSDSVLIHGPTGSGKELFAQLIHFKSGRTGRLVSVNCAAISPNLFEDKFFGHFPGAFEGARKPELGHIREADKGTLFLDEIADLSGEHVPKFLRVLEEKVVTPLGSTQSIPVDFRFIGATDQDLSKLRPAFLERFTKVLKIPPLADRPWDIVLLAHFFIDQLAAEAGLPLVRIGRDAIDKLTSYSWPFNIRQLKNCIKVACITRKTTLTAPDFEIVEKGQRSAGETIPSTYPGLSEEESFQRQHLIDILHSLGGNMTVAAKKLGIAKNTLHAWMKKLDIPRPTEQGGGSQKPASWEEG